MASSRSTARRQGRGRWGGPCSWSLPTALLLLLLLWGNGVKAQTTPDCTITTVNSFDVTNSYPYFYTGDYITMNINYTNANFILLYTSRTGYANSYESSYAYLSVDEVSTSQVYSYSFDLNKQLWNAYTQGAGTWYFLLTCGNSQRALSPTDTVAFQVYDSQSQFFNVQLFSSNPLYEGDYLIFYVDYFINERTISNETSIDQIKPYLATSGGYSELSSYSYERGISGANYIYIPTTYGQNYIENTGTYNFDWLLLDPYYNQTVSTYIYMKSVDGIYASGGCMYDKSKGDNCWLYWFSNSGHNNNTVSLYVTPDTGLTPTVVWSSDVQIYRIEFKADQSSSTTYYAPIAVATTQTSAGFNPATTAVTMSSGQWKAYAIVYEDSSNLNSGSVLRYTSSVAFTVPCPSLYYGLYCNEKQNLTTSTIFGFLAGGLTLLITVLFLWSDWPQRAAEHLRKDLTEKSVGVARSVVKYVKKVRKGHDEAGGGSHSAGHGSNHPPKPPHPAGGGQLKVTDARQQDPHGVSTAAAVGAAAVTGAMVAGVAVTAADTGGPEGGSNNQCCLFLCCRKLAKLLKELVLATCAWAVGIVIMYGVDILMILANGLLMIKSFAASFHMNVDIVLPKITMDIAINLPSWLHWYPNFFQVVLEAIEKVFSKIQFQTFAMQAMQALSNVIIAAVIFLLLEVYFLEAIRITFRGFARVLTVFAGTKSAALGRAAGATLPGVAVSLESLVKYVLQFVFAMISISVFFQSRGMHNVTDVCDTEGKGMDSNLAKLGTALFWLTAFPIIHLALKALVPGLPVGDRGPTLNAIRNQNLARVLGPSYLPKQGGKARATSSIKGDDVDKMEAGAAVGASKDRQVLAVEGPPKGCQGCLTRVFGHCFWSLATFIFGLNPKEGLDDLASTTDRMDKPQCCCCCCRQDCSHGCTDEDHGCCGRVNKCTERCCGRCCPTPRCSWYKFTLQAAHLLRLTILVFIATLALVRFMVVVIKTSRTTNFQALNMTCASVPTYYDSLSASSKATLAQSGYPTFECDTYDYSGKETLYQEACILRTKCGIQELSKTFTGEHALIVAAVVCVPLVLLWFISKRFLRWHKTQCDKNIEFQDAQQRMPSWVLCVFGYLSHSEKKLQKRLHKLEMEIQSPPTTPRGGGGLFDRFSLKKNRGGGQGNVTPPLSPVGSPRSSIKSTGHGLKKLRGGSLPRPWPSVYAVFEMAKPADRDYLVWQDFVEGKRLLDEMKAMSFEGGSWVEGGDGNAPPIAITDQYLRNNFIYRLITNCERSPDYEAAVKSVFDIVSSFSDHREAKAALRQASSPRGKRSPVQALMSHEVLQSPRAVSVQKEDGTTETTMDLDEFRHFVRILVPPREVPSYLELLILIFGVDIKQAFQRWWKDDNASIRHLYRVVPYWFDRTAKDYLVVMTWKFMQLVKLTFGFWDREMVEAFRIRDKADVEASGTGGVTLSSAAAYDDDAVIDARLCAMGQTRALFWQICSYTVVLSKLGEALNYSPFYIEDDIMTKEVSFKREEDPETKEVGYVPEPLLRGMKPFAPPFLLWLFPLEYQRAMQLQQQRHLQGNYSPLAALQGLRMQAFLVNVAKFMTTLFLVTFQGAVWLRAYAIFALPFRIVDAFDTISALHIDTSTLQEIGQYFTQAMGWVGEEKLVDQFTETIRDNLPGAGIAMGGITGGAAAVNLVVAARDHMVDQVQGQVDGLQEFEGVADEGEDEEEDDGGDAMKKGGSSRRAMGFNAASSENLDFGGGDGEVDEEGQGGDEGAVEEKEGAREGAEDVLPLPTEAQTGQPADVGTGAGEEGGQQQEEVSGSGSNKDAPSPPAPADIPSEPQPSPPPMDAEVSGGDEEGHVMRAGHGTRHPSLSEIPPITGDQLVNAIHSRADEFNEIETSTTATTRSPQPGTPPPPPPPTNPTP